VALKEIQPHFAQRADQRARFVLEAEITGNLEHPGIVPVYSLGKNADGRPFYAMRFIRGDTFSLAIRRFHDNDRAQTSSASRRSRGGSKWGVEFRQLVRRFLDVCDAIEYAHSRGVLHRDLKPANIMLGHYGETLVVDWGLAKVIGEHDFVGLEHDVEARGGAFPESGTIGGRTEQGTTIGTPAYMSPEQASGQIDQLGPVSDVYSLGASLYELLTGQPAFRQQRLAAMVEKVLAGDFPPPRAVDRSIPAPLQAICLKAMARDAPARYGSVRALAQDLEQWLADAPVAAYPEGRLERLGRWVRQHRTWAYAGAAAVMGIAFVASAAVVVTEAARRSETIARKEAETNFEMAQQAVEQYLTNVSENTLLKEQDTLDIRTLRHDLLKSALEYYQRFARERRHDPQLRRQLAQAYFRVGQITTEIGSLPLAIDSLRAAHAIWEPLVKAGPSDHALAASLSDCTVAIGKIEAAQNDYTAAASTLSQARVILERLVAARPAEASYQSRLANCYVEIGIVRARLAQLEESLAIHEKARVIQQELISRFPDDIRYQRSLAENINAIGYANYRRLDDDAALGAFHQVEEICKRIMTRQGGERKPAWLLNLLALSQYNIGSILRKQGDLEKALPQMEQAVASRAALAEQHPSVTQFQEKLGVGYREIAEVEHEVHQDAKALRSIQKSVEIYKRLVHSQPDHAGFHSALALGWNVLGCILDDRRDADAFSAFESALKEQEVAIAKGIDAERYRGYLCYHLDNTGLQYVELGRLADGLPFYERSLRISRELSAAHPESRDLSLELVKRLVTLGNIHRHLGAPLDARQLFTQAKPIIDRLIGPSSGDAVLRTWLAVVLDNEANTFAEEGQPGTARPLLERAAALLRRQVDERAYDRERALEREARSEALWDLARVLRALSLAAEARRVDEERNEVWQARRPDELVALVLKETERAVLIGYGRTEISERARAVRKLDLDQAAANLQLAIARGFKDVRRLEAHPDASFLLSRDDLRPAIAHLKTAEPPQKR
jgi:eukaryotic-like serine/threonine-protein kinase